MRCLIQSSENTASVWNVGTPSASQPLFKQFQQELLLSSETQRKTLRKKLREKKSKETSEKKLREKQSFFSVLSALHTGMIIIIDNHAGMIIFRLCFVSQCMQAHSLSTCNKGSIGKCNFVLKPANWRHSAALGSFS